MRFSRGCRYRPHAQVPLFAGHDDGFVGRAYSIDFGTLASWDIVYDIVLRQI